MTIRRKSHPDLIEMLPKTQPVITTASAASGRRGGPGHQQAPVQSRCRLAINSAPSGLSCTFFRHDFPNPRVKSRRCSHKRPWHSWRRLSPASRAVSLALAVQILHRAPRPIADTARSLGLSVCLPYRRQRLRLYRQYPCRAGNSILVHRASPPCYAPLRNTRLEMILR